jgi:hypothetical protein
MDFVCNKCGKAFNQKAHLNYHIENDVCEGKSSQCKLCGKGFTSQTSMYRHLRNSCKVKKEEDREKDKIYARLLELEKQNKEIRKENKEIRKENKEIKTGIVSENKKLKKEVVIMKKNMPNISVGNIVNGNMNNNLNIILVGYGKEDLSRIDRNDVIKALQNGFNSSVKLTEMMHFNPKYPEFHNVYISNMKDKYAMTYDGKDWNLTIKEDLINKIYDDKKNYIEENLDDFVDSLTTSRKNALDRWLAINDDDEKILKIKNEIKLLLYNKRNLVEPVKIKSIKNIKN